MSLKSAMPGYPCPTCGRALNLGDELWGSLVKCPMCETEFEAPSEPPRPQPRPPMAALGARATERAPLPYHEPGEDDREPGPGTETALRSASAWLLLAVLLQAISGLLCCCGPSLEGNGDTIFLTVPMTFVLKYVPLLFAALASSRLTARRSAGLCRAGGILVLWTSLWGMLEALLGFVLAGFEHRRSFPPGTLLLFLFALIGVPGILCGIVASVKTLSVLARPGVARTFQ